MFSWSCPLYYLENPLLKVFSTFYVSGGAPSGGQTVMVMGQGQPVQGGGGMMGGQQQQQQQQPMMTPAGPGGPTPSGYHHQLQTTGHGSSRSAPGMATTSYQSITVLSKGQPVGTGAAMTICKKCQKQPANPGHSWCQSCFINKS